MEAAAPPRPILAFSKNFVLVASRRGSINVWSIEDRRRVGSLVCGKSPASAVATCILVDTSMPSAHRVLAGFSDGSCRIWSLYNEASGCFAADALCTIPGRSSDESILAAAICDAVVVVCTSHFDIVFYRLIAPSEPGRLWTTKEFNRVGWHSRICWAPVDLHLLRAGPGIAFSLHVAYASPTATGDWQVGLEHISFSTDSAKVTTQHFSPSNSKLLPKSASPLTCLRFRAPYLVTAHADNVVQLYMMMASPTRRKPQRTALVHLSPLYAHSAAVTALDLDAASGKLVTAGFDGIKIWELQPQTDGSVKIPEPTVTLVDEETAAQWGLGGDQHSARVIPLWLGFDAGRIISYNGRGTFAPSTQSSASGKGESDTPDYVVKIFSFLDE
ncbi:hypothetical protein HDU87_001760 [Geranomyces variabilis]|uniref:Uncharacterized protein n=1 Tax=Geranomyces variabilis TaxID=109894 RepID=A0AAD5XSD9_9FUNG|nr:hypothetical protein HDU87_001760 [Geranomyces variabilis]